MFREALGYPTRPPVGGRAVLLGGLVLILVLAFSAAATLQVFLAPAALVAFVLWLVVRGYYVRVVRTTIGRETPTPPGFDGFGKLLADGIRAVLVSVAYLLPAIVVLGPLVYSQTLGSDLGTLLVGAGVPPRFEAPAISGFGIVALFALMYGIGAIYAIPVAVANFAYTGRFRAAFDLETVVSGATTEDYVVAWGVSLLMQVLLLPITYVLRVLLVGFFLQFLVAMGVRYCYGQGVGAALGLDPIPLEAEQDDKTVRSAFVRVDAADGSVTETRATGGRSDSTLSADPSGESRPTLVPAEESRADSRRDE
jgi:hypothetical protein